MQKIGVVQKGFFLTTIVLLAVVFFASLYADTTGYASTRMVLAPRQPITPFSLNIISKNSGSSTNPTATACGFKCPSIKCALDEYCGWISGSMNNANCGCIKKPGMWVDTNVYCGSFIPATKDRQGYCTIQLSCPPSEVCDTSINDVGKPIDSPRTCTCYRFVEESFSVH